MTHSPSRAQIVPATLRNLGNPIDIGTWAIINSCFSIGGLLGSYGVVVPLALLGRKKTLLVTNVFVFASCAARVACFASLPGASRWRTRSCPSSMAQLYGCPACLNSTPTMLAVRRSAFLYYGTTWYWLVCGRICIGVVAGVAQMVAGSYMTEISPIGIRGSVGVCSQVVTVRPQPLAFVAPCCPLAR